MKKLSVWVFIAWVGVVSVGVAREAITIAFWNVENLFDLVDDPATNDDEFAIGGRKNMTPEILDLKLDHMAQVLTDLDADIIGLCEVENRLVLDMLNQRYPGRDYAIVHYDSPDSRGIDVALLYDDSVFTVLDSRPVPVVLPDDKTTRDILYVRGLYREEELHIFVNHWPSKWGGVEATIPLRAQAAQTLRREIERILMNDPKAEIVVIGDLNDEPTDPSVEKHLGATMEREKIGTAPYILLNLMKPFYRKKNCGTYKYNNKDLVYDQIIVSPGLVDSSGLAIVPESVHVADNPQYRQASGPYSGYPFRFWVRDKLLGGYSDHMAVSVSIEKR